MMRDYDKGSPRRNERVATTERAAAPLPPDACRAFNPSRLVAGDVRSPRPAECRTTLKTTNIETIYPGEASRLPSPY